MNPDEFRNASRDVWNKMARGWDSNRDYMWETSRPVGEWLVRNLDLRPGHTVLEVAAGMGDSGFLAAGLVGDGGRLISTDFSPSMVEGARRRAAEMGIGNAEFRPLDAENMDLDDDSVDGVICRWGFMLMNDPAAAFSECRRVLRPGGKLCFSVFSTPDKNPWAAVPARALVEAGLMEAPPAGKPGIFGLADVDRARTLLTDAGFAEPRIEEVPLTWRHAGFDDYWRFLTEVAGAIASLIESLPPDGRTRAREAIRQAIAPFHGDDGIALPAVTMNVAVS
jgi:ubiquinone/menaquinone biosynthesis C-methylase UbiE